MDIIKSLGICNKYSRNQQAVFFIEDKNLECFSCVSWFYCVSVSSRVSVYRLRRVFRLPFDYLARPPSLGS